jgi:hypothetical protein
VAKLVGEFMLIGLKFREGYLIEEKACSSSVAISVLINVKMLWHNCRRSGWHNWGAHSFFFWVCVKCQNSRRRLCNCGDDAMLGERI